METTKQRANWSSWRNYLFNIGEALANRFGRGSLPIPLHGIASARKVRAVIFRPLLVDGCLTVKEDGFKIYVRCGKYQVENLDARFRNEKQNNLLPPRTRFTIAHEIAHTLLFDLSSDRPKSKLLAEHVNTLNALERVCNQVGARILLPTELMRIEMKAFSVFDPDALRCLAVKAGVSGPMLVNRLQELTTYIEDIGAFAYVSREKEQNQIRAIAMHPILKSMFPHAHVGETFSRLIADRRFVLNGGTEFTMRVGISCSTGWTRGIQTFDLAAERRGLEGQSSGYFVVVRRLGEPEFRQPVSRFP